MPLLQEQYSIESDSHMWHSTASGLLLTFASSIKWSHLCGQADSLWTLFSMEEDETIEIQCHDLSSISPLLDWKSSP